MREILPLFFRPIFEGKIGQALSELVKAAVSDHSALKLAPTCSYSGVEEHGKRAEDFSMW